MQSRALGFFENRAIKIEQVWGRTRIKGVSLSFKCSLRYRSVCFCPAATGQDHAPPQHPSACLGRVYVCVVGCWGSNREHW